MNSGNFPSAVTMEKSGIQPERISYLNKAKLADGKFVLYWMQASQREHFNPALEYTIMLANHYKKSLLVAFVITPSYPEANSRHYSFMIEGIQDVEKSLKKRKLDFCIKVGSPVDEVLKLSKNACAIVTDRGYTYPQVEWRSSLASKANVPVIQVEGDVVVPIESASDHEEYAARTIRPKINKQRKKFIVPLKRQVLKNKSVKKGFKSENISDLSRLIKKLDIDKDITKSSFFKGGYSEAKRRLTGFIKSGLATYNKNNDPTEDSVSRLSPYLHFGNISPVEIALDIQKAGGKYAEDFLEQLIVRRELAMNFTYYSDLESSWQSLPEWAIRSLDLHNKDRREYIYSFEEFQKAETHDPAWNAAQLEMVITGHMHGYMRMYWGKKIIEWTADWKTAYDIMLKLNNKYELDGRDPNAYAGVAWCFGKHDTAWKERPIFGKIRYMNFQGLKRKFNVEKYIDKIALLPEYKLW